MSYEVDCGVFHLGENMVVHGKDVLKLYLGLW